MSYEERLRIGHGAAEQIRAGGQAYCRAEKETGRARFQIRRQNRRTRNLPERRTGQSDRQSGLRSDGTARTPTRERTQDSPGRTRRKERSPPPVQEKIGVLLDRGFSASSSSPERFALDQFTAYVQMNAPSYSSRSSARHLGHWRFVLRHNTPTWSQNFRCFPKRSTCDGRGNHIWK